MNNQLTQAELIELAKEAGFKETVWRNILGVNVESLAKFAQLIQQQGEVEPVAWFAFADSNGHVPLELWGFDEKECKYAVLMNARATGWKGTIEGYLLHAGWSVRPIYTSPPTASQLVEQALEKAAKECDRISDEYYAREGMKYPELKTDAETGANECAFAIRALIDQPGDHIEDSLGMVEQGGDELATVVSTQVGFLKFYLNHGAGKVYLEDVIKALEKALSQALANRMGGE